MQRSVSFEDEACHFLLCFHVTICYTILYVQGDHNYYQSGLLYLCPCKYKIHATSLAFIRRFSCTLGSSCLAIKFKLMWFCTFINFGFIKNLFKKRPDHYSVTGYDINMHRRRRRFIHKTKYVHT